MVEIKEILTRRVSLQQLIIDLEEKFGFNLDNTIEIFYAGGFLTAEIQRDVGSIETIRYIVIKNAVGTTKLYGFDHKTINHGDFMRLVLNLMNSGISQREIARRTGVSKKTVDITVKDTKTLGVEVDGPCANYSFVLSS